MLDQARWQGKMRTLCEGSVTAKAAARAVCAHHAFSWRQETAAGTIGVLPIMGGFVNFVVL